MGVGQPGQVSAGTIGTTVGALLLAAVTLFLAGALILA